MPPLQIAYRLIMTSDLENLFSSAYSHGEYLGQGLLKSVH